jgi:hypothetical protein
VVACGQGQKHPRADINFDINGADVPARGRMEDAVRNPEINTQRTAADDPGQQFSGFLSRVRRVRERPWTSAAYLFATTLCPWSSAPFRRCPCRLAVKLAVKTGEVGSGDFGEEVRFEPKGSSDITVAWPSVRESS